MSRSIARTMMLGVGAAAASLTISTLLALGTSTPPASLTAIDTAYTQNFDTLAGTGASNALPAGWALEESGTSARNDGNYTAGVGSDNAGDVYAFGSAGSTDRAFGTLRSGTLVPIIGASFSNNTGSTITSLDVAYTGEEWRLGTANRADELDFQYSTTATAVNAGAYTGVAALNFVTPATAGAIGAKDGNAAANRTVLSATITGLSIPPGATFWIRWIDFDASGADDGLAIDDFSLTPHGSVVSTGPTAVGSANPSSVAAGGSTLLTVNVTPGSEPSSTGLAVTGDLTTIGGAPNAPFFDDGTNGDVTAGDNIFTLLATVTLGTPPGAKSLPIIVTDEQARTANTSISLTVTPPPVQTVPIHTIQGNGSTSPLTGQVVATTGIVTGVKSNGFYIQTPDADIDADPATSEGIFVFTGAAVPAAAVVGNQLTVQGTVSEFIPSADLNSPPTTELSGALTVVLTSSGNPLPAAIVLTPADTDPAGSIEQLERFEGMRVRVNSLTTSSPTSGNINEANATSTSDGTFYGVITGVARPFREPGVEVPDPLPAGSPPGVTRFDANPERLRVETSTLNGSVALNVTSNVVLANVVGPLDYRFRTYAILADPASPPTVTTPNMTVSAVRSATADEFTVASFNMERFFDTVNDPSVSDVALTPTAFNNRLNKASLAIRHVLRSPDIIGVEEVENLTTLQAVAAKVNNDAVGDGQPDPGYQAFLVEGNDIGGIDSGFLVKTPRVTAVDVTQFGQTTTYVEPGGGVAILNDRPPLVLRAEINSAGHPPYAVTVIVNHLRSLSGVDDPADGDRVRTKRRAQAEYLASLIQSRQAADPTERIVSVGDYNAFQFNDGYVDSIGTIKGTPTPANQVVLASADLVNPDLMDLVDGVPASERYSFSFDGNAQELDHVLVTTGPQNRLTAIDLQYGRMDADFPEVYRNDPNRPERVSDHDPLVAYFSLAGPLDCTTAVANPPVMISTTTRSMRGLSIDGVTGGTSPAVTIDAICQDEPPNDGSAAMAIDGAGVGTASGRVRTERSGSAQNPGNGRVYHIFFTATDGGSGGVCSGQVTVSIPFSTNQAAVDNGALFDSTTSNGAACAVPSPQQQQ